MSLQVNYDGNKTIIYNTGTTSVSVVYSPMTWYGLSGVETCCVDPNCIIEITGVILSTKRNGMQCSRVPMDRVLVSEIEDHESISSYIHTRNEECCSVCIIC